MATIRIPLSTRSSRVPAVPGVSGLIANSSEKASATWMIRIGSVDICKTPDTTARWNTPRQKAATASTTAGAVTAFRVPPDRSPDARGSDITDHSPK